MDSILLFDAQMVLLHIKKCIVVMIVFNEFNEGFWTTRWFAWSALIWEKTLWLYGGASNLSLPSSSFTFDKFG